MRRARYKLVESVEIIVLSLLRGVVESSSVVDIGGNKNNVLDALVLYKGQDLSKLVLATGEL